MTSFKFPVFEKNRFEALHAICSYIDEKTKYYIWLCATYQKT